MEIFKQRNVLLLLSVSLLLWISVKGQSFGSATSTTKADSGTEPVTVTSTSLQLPLCGDEITRNCLLPGPTAMSWDSAHLFCRHQGGFLLAKEEQLQLVKQYWPPANVTLSPEALVTLRPRKLDSQNLTWTALAKHNGHYQWLSQFPDSFAAVGQFVEWSVTPKKWSKECGSFHIFSKKINLVPCSYPLRFFCFLPDAPAESSALQGTDLDDVELLVTANIKAGENWVEVNSEEDFVNLALTCSAVSKRTGRQLSVQPPIFWSKDGVYIDAHTKRLIPSLVHDSTKSPVTDWWSEESYVHLRQGTFWCESWVLNSSSRLKSNKILVTLKDWIVLILVAKREEFFNATSRTATEDIRNTFRPALYGIDNYTIDVIDEKREILSNQRILVTYRFQVHVPLDENCHDLVLSIFQNNSQISTELYQKHGYLNSSSVSLATYCLQHDEKYDYGNRITWPFTKTGVVLPKNYKCRIADNKLQAGFCHWNYTHGGTVDFSPSECKRFDPCPSGYTSISGYLCVTISSPDTWEAGLEKIYKTGLEMSILDSAEFFQSDGMQKTVSEYITEMSSLYYGEELVIWLPVRRIVSHGPLQYVGPRKIHYPYFDKINDIFNVSWVEHHPISNLNCLALKLKTRQLFTLDCTTNLPYIGLLNISGFSRIPTTGWKSEIPHLIVKNPQCPLDWYSSMYKGTDNICFKLFVDAGEFTWKESKEFCERKGAHLPTPGIGFLDWVYRQYIYDNHVPNVWMTEHINISYKRYTDGKSIEFVNWLATTDFSQQNSCLSTDGWYREGENATKSSVLCQVEIILKIPNIKLHKDNNRKQKPICLDITENVLDKIFEDIRCYVNGRSAPLIFVNDSECHFEIGYSQGYYECHLWLRNTSHLAKSVTFLNRNENALTFAVNLSQAMTYHPEEHDSTFFSSTSGITFITDCAASFTSYLQSEIDNMRVSANSFFYSPGVNNSILFHNFNIEIEMINDDAPILTEYEMLIQLAEIFRNEQNFSQCSLVSIQSTVGCIGEITQVFGLTERNLTWPTVKGSKTVLPQELCINYNGEPVTRECKGSFLTGYRWGKISSGCTGRPSNITKTLWNINQEQHDEPSAALDTICNLTANESILKAADIHFVATKLKSISKEKHFKENDLEGVVETLNNLMEADDETFKAVHKKLNTSSILFEAFENITFKIDLPPSEGDQTVNATRNLISVERLDLEINSTVIGYQSIDGGKQEETLTKGFERDKLIGDAAILLPENLTYTVATSLAKQAKIQSGKKKRKVKLTFAVYRTPKLFQDYKSFPNYSVGSNIIQASYNGKMVKNLKQPVTLFFKHSEKGNDSKCVFWDFKKNRGLGGWSTKGCWKGPRRGDHDICFCNHLTCFAQLINYNDDDFDEDHAIALDIITVIGCSLSIIGLLMVFATFFLFKKWRRSLSNKILVNLSFSVFCTLVIFLAGINQTWNVILCRSIAVSLHYFILASFGWMLVEAVHQYLKFVKVVGTYIPRFLWKASVSAWGAPIIPIIIMLVYDSTLYDSNLADDSPAKICWMSTTGFMYAFLPPLALTMFTNLIMFSLILYGAVCGRARVNSTMSERTLVMSQLSMAICVFFLLGFTWIFGILSIWKGRLLFSYLFCIFNTLQGFFIFLFHVCREKSARRLWKDFLSVITKQPVSSSDPVNSNNILSLHYKGHLDTIGYNHGGGTNYHPRRVSADTGRGSIKSNTTSTLLHSRTSYRP